MNAPAVLNKYHRNAPTDAVYIGRGSVWGNPFVIGPDGDREAVIKAHLLWLTTQPDLVARARRELAGKSLVCFCAPAACHGDILLRVASGEFGQTSEEIIAGLLQLMFDDGQFSEF